MLQLDELMLKDTIKTDHQGCITTIPYNYCYDENLMQCA